MRPQAQAAAGGSVEWEELPALPHVMLRRQVPHASYAIASELVLEAQGKLREGVPAAPVKIQTLPAIFDPLREIPGMDAFADKTRFTGYLRRTVSPRARSRRASATISR